MQTMAISKFKAQCLAALERVNRTGEPLTVTRFGKVVAEVVPPKAEKKKKSWIGSMKGKFEIVGDIVSPITLEEQGWEVLEYLTKPAKKAKAK